MFSKGLLSARRHSVTFSLSAQSRRCGQRRPRPAPASGHSLRLAGTSEPLTRGSMSPLCVHGLLPRYRWFCPVGGWETVTQIRAPHQEFSSHHLLPVTPVPWEGLDVELQLSSWGQGAPRGFQTWLLPFSLSQAVVTPLYQDTPGDPALCNPVSWGFPQSFALSGLQAARQRDERHCSR